MKTHKSILVLSLLSFCVVVFTPMQAQDYQRLSERSIMGTARYVGMGGAMTAIGGDASAAHDNPAGLGLYRRMEAMLSTGGSFDRANQIGTSLYGRRNSFELPQASIVFSIPTYNSSGIQFHNFMLSYRQLNNYRRTMKAAGTDDPSLGALISDYNVKMDIDYMATPTNAINEMALTETGYSNEYAFDYAMNISDRWYVGLGLRVQSYIFTSDGKYYERFNAINAEGKYMDNQNESHLVMSGASCNFAAGFLCRPVQFLRLGFGIQTPSVGSLRTFTQGTFSSVTDSLRYSNAPDNRSLDRAFHRPLHLSSSLAFQIGAYGMAAFQYDYFHAKGQDDIHSLRAGIEVIPVLGLYINAGYVYESTFKATRPAYMDPEFGRQDTYTVSPRWSQYASIAIGYRGTYMLVQAAYQYRWQKVAFYAHENMAPYDINADTHRFVVSVGWHHP